MALCSQVVDLARLDLVDQFHEASGVGEVSIVQLEVLPLLEGQRVLVQVPDPGRVEGAGASDDAVHLVPLGEEQLGQVGAVLQSDRTADGQQTGQMTASSDIVVLHYKERCSLNDTV